MKTNLTTRSVIGMMLAAAAPWALAAPQAFINTVNGVDTATAPFVFGNEPTVTIAGYAMDAATKDAGTLTAVNVYNATTKKTYPIPVLRRVAYPLGLASFGVADLKAGLTPSLLSSGFIAATSAYSLPEGSYTVQSVTMKMKTTPGSASLDVAPSRAGQFTIPDGRINPDVTVTAANGTSYNVGIARNTSPTMNGKMTLTGYPALRSGDYVVTTVARGPYGNATGTTSLNVRYRRNVATVSASQPIAENFNGGQSLVSLVDPLTNIAMPAADLPAKATVILGAASGRASFQGKNLDAAPGVEIDVTIPTKGGRHALYGTATGNSKTVNVWINRPDAPNIKVDLNPWDPDASMQLKPASTFFATNVDQVQITATTVGTSHCNQIVSILEGASMPAGNYEPPVCAMRFKPLPAGLSIETATKRNLVGYLTQEGEQSIDYDTGILWTDATGATAFYRASTHALKIAGMTPQEPDITMTPIDKLTPLTQASPGKHLTFTGSSIAGRLTVLGKYPGMTVEITPAGFATKTLVSNSNSVSDFVTTNISDVFGTQDFVVTSWFSRAPSTKFTKTVTFTAVALSPIITLSNVSSLSTGDTTMKGNIGLYQGKEGFVYDETKVGTWSVQLYEVANTGTKTALGNPVTGFGSDGLFTVPLGKLPPGQRRLMAVATTNNTSVGVADQTIQSTQVTLAVADASPLGGKISVSALNGPVPFSPALSIGLDNPARVSDLGTITWFSSPDGSTYNPVAGSGTSLRPQLMTSGYAWFKATIANRFDPAAVTELAPVEVQAFAVPKVTLSGDSATIVGYGATLHATANIDADFTWYVSKSVSDMHPDVISGTDTITVTPTAANNMIIKVVASEKGAPVGNSARNTTATTTLVVGSAKLQKPLISGPSYIETGKTYTFKATTTPIFTKGLKTTLVQKGHWVMPDGTLIDSDTVDYAVTEGDKSLRYEAWIDGMTNTLTGTDFVFKTWQYAWPAWQMTTRVIDNKVPATLSFAVAAMGTGIQGMGGEQPLYDWQPPPSFQTLSRSGSSVTIQANEPGDFQMAGTVSDSRGNVTFVSSDVVRISPAPDLVPALILQSGDRWNRAPNKLYARVNIVSLPKNDTVATTTFKLDDAEITTGKSMIAYIDVPTVGTHDVKAVVTSAGGKIGADTQSITLGTGDAPVCRINQSGNGTTSLTLTASCSVIQGSIATYQWTANGQSLSMTGNMVSFARIDLDKGIWTATVTAVTDKGQTGSATWAHP